MTSKTAITAPPSNGEAGPAAAQGHNRPEGDLKTTDGLRAKNEIPTGETPGDKPDADKTVCRGYASYLSGPCLAGQPRQLRVRAATDGPDVARLPLGRTTAATPAETSAKVAEGPPEEVQGSAQDHATAVNAPSAEHATQDREHSSRVSPKKSQKTARNANGHRDEPENGYSWREDRAGSRVDRISTNDNRGET